MKFYGYFKSKYIENGFVMPIFEEDSILYFQKIEDGIISLEKVDTDKYDFDTPVEFRIDKKFDFKKRIYVFKDIDKIYAGELKEIIILAPSFKLYEKYQDYFSELQKRYAEKLKDEINQKPIFEVEMDKVVQSIMIKRAKPLIDDRCRAFARRLTNAKIEDATPKITVLINGKPLVIQVEAKAFSARKPHSVRQARVGVVRLPNPNTINGRPLAIDIEEMQSQMRRAQAVQYKRSAKRATISKDKVLVKS